MPDVSYFITLEGGEGTGKTTQAKRLVGAFEAAGHVSTYTKEPGGTPVADRIRSVLLYSDDEKVNERCELFLFLAARAQHVSSKVVPLVEGGTTVICDRFSGSTFAYQVGGRGIVDADLVTKMDAFARYDKKPDLTVYLDIDPEVGVKRKQIQLQQEMTRFDEEAQEFHRKVRASFIQLSEENDDWITVPAIGTIEEVGDAVRKAVGEKLGISL